MSNTSSKVPIVVSKRVGVLTEFVRLKVSISPEKSLPFSPLHPDTSIFKSLAAKILSYLLLDLLFLITFERKPSHILVAYKWNYKNYFPTPFSISITSKREKLVVFYHKFSISKSFIKFSFMNTQDMNWCHM